MAKRIRRLGVALDDDGMRDLEYIARYMVRKPDNFLTIMDIKKQDVLAFAVNRAAESIRKAERRDNRQKRRRRRTAR